MTTRCTPRIERTGGFTAKGEESYFARLVCPCGATGEWRVGYFGADDDLRRHKQPLPEQPEPEPLF